MWWDSSSPSHSPRLFGDCSTLVGSRCEHQSPGQLWKNTSLQCYQDRSFGDGSTLFGPWGEYWTAGPPWKVTIRLCTRRWWRPRVCLSVGPGRSAARECLSSKSISPLMPEPTIRMTKWWNVSLLGPSLRFRPEPMIRMTKWSRSRSQPCQRTSCISS